MWRHPAAAPTERDWTLPIIADLNPNRGRELFERVAAHEREPLRAAWSKANAITLGNRTFCLDLARFLDALPNPTGSEAARARFVGGEALRALSLANYTEALDTIRNLRARQYPDPRLAVYEAQFAGDVAGVEALARPEPSATAALRALVVMGRPEAVKEMAKDESNPLRDKAQRVLAGERLE